MNKVVAISIAGVLGLASSAVMAEKDPLDRCLDAVKKEKSGKFVKVERLDFEGKPTYEIELWDDAGNEWEFMCDAATGKIFETESEVESENDPRFRSKMKVDLETAKKTALKRYPGTVREIEYEIESNGDASYEIDIADESGRETKVEVDAATGKIIEVSEELWQIGEEAEEHP
ncbi:PepSY domain-containing protein [Methylohalobius crimeensis]|uniref:PepSY domain-containing protein n=1 Tax=Methylohalobius crimeensis TaxID=244365 RepID=UPI0003B5F1DB|nr:PepSY domain-containing protein [Methylohalobius crimeensis]